MAVFNKPEFNSVWANSGTKQAPSVEKISVGWVVEIPPHEYANWLENRRDAMLAHLNQAGIPYWDATVQYQAGKSYVQGNATGVIYRCLVTNTAINPDLDIQGNWEVAFQRNGETLMKLQNLADVPNKELARTNLGIPTTADYDSRYLRASNNLADVPNKATARNILGLGNSAVLDVDTIINITKTPQFGVNTANGLIIKTGKVTASTTNAGGVIVTFPERFPNECVFFSIGAVSSTTAGAEYVQVLDYNAQSARGLTYTNVATLTVGTCTFTYMAWGW